MLQMPVSTPRVDFLPPVEAFPDDVDVRLSDAAVALLPDRTTVERLHTDLSRDARDFATLVLRYGNPSQAFRHPS